MADRWIIGRIANMEVARKSAPDGTTRDLVTVDLPNDVRLLSFETFSDINGQPRGVLAFAYRADE